MQQAYLFKNEVLDFYFFYDDIKPGFLTNVSDGGVMEIPEALIRPIARNFNWENANLPTPNQLETYLAWRYGKDWETPKTDKQPWFSDHPNIRPLDYATILEPGKERTNPSNWKVGSSVLGKSACSPLELVDHGVAVFEDPSLISLWSSRNRAHQERDSLITERDSLITERDSLRNSRSWKYTRALRAVWGFFAR